MKNKSNLGISLITLVITIVVVIILAGVIIFSVINTNINEKAQEAVFKSDVANFKEELRLYHNNKMLEMLGNYESKQLDGDREKLEYKQKIEENKTMTDPIKTMLQKPEYTNKFIIFEGELVYIGDRKEEKDWAKDIGIDSKHEEPLVELIGPTPNEVKAGNKVEYKITARSKFKFVEMNYNKIYISKKVGENTNFIRSIEETEVKVTLDEENKKELSISVDTTNMDNANYFLTINPGFIVDIMDKTKTIPIFSSDFKVNTIEYSNPTFKLTPNSYTNSDVSVEIVYPEGITIKQYKLNQNEQWKDYTSPIIVNTNNITVYAKGEDKLTNETKVSTVTISNIDKISPTISISNISKTTSSVTIKTVASDTGGSQIDTSSYEYSKDGGSTWIKSSNSEYTFSGLVAGTAYNFKARVTDNATNVGVSNTLSVITNTIESLGSIELVPNTRSWTRSVSVTITYPLGFVTRQYKVGSNGTWQTYTESISVSSNTTIYARGIDVGGNASNGNASVSISNIDSTSPTISLTESSKTTSSITVKASATDSQSGINTSSYEYSKDNGSTWTSKTSSTTYTFNGLSAGTSYSIKVRVTDNAGNVGVSNTLSVSIQKQCREERIQIVDEMCKVSCYHSCSNSCTYSGSNCVTVPDPKNPGQMIEYCRDPDCFVNCTQNCNLPCYSYETRIVCD